MSDALSPDPDRRGPHEPPGDEINTEIADHLACAAERLEQQGVDSREAEQSAQERFGDVARVRRRCWWIQHGDEVMFRTISICLLVLVGAGLVVVGYGGWHMQHTFAERMDNLTEQLAAMANAQRDAAASRAQSALPDHHAIVGRAYLGNESIPAAGAEIKILSIPELGVVRCLRVDEQGRFDSQPLPDGDYALMASLRREQEDGAQIHYPMLVQSRPVYLFPGADNQPVQLDLKYHAGEVEMGLAEPAPELIEEAGREFEVFVRASVTPRDVRFVPINPHIAVGAYPWPMVGAAAGLAERYGMGGYGLDHALEWSAQLSPPQEVYYTAVSSDGDGDASMKPRMERTLPVGDYVAAATVLGKWRNPGPKTGREGFGEYEAQPGYPGGASQLTEPASGLYGGVPMDDEEVMTLMRARIRFRLADGEKLRLQIELPEGYESRVRELLAANPVDNQALPQVQPAKIKVIRN